MPNNYFSFKEFTVYQDKCIFKVGTDGVLAGATADVAGAENILDIGTGTGLIALMLAQRTGAGIYAIEPDENSFIQACSNFSNSKWGGRIKAFNTSLQDFDPGPLKFDLIVCNPPFFSDSLRNPDKEKASARHNDQLKNSDLLKGASGLLTGEGKLHLIMPYAEGNILIAEAHEYGFYCNNIIKVRPLPTSSIRRLILTFSKTRNKTSESFLTIEHGKRHDFTDEYRDLTRDFYLKF